jgi:hypothetical protein
MRRLAGGLVGWRRRRGNLQRLGGADLQNLEQFQKAKKGGHATLSVAEDAEA